MKIGELAARTGVSPRAIRHYEKAGLLSAGRLLNGYRDFGDEAVAEVKHVVRMIRLGFSLEEIATFPACMFTGGAAVICPVAMQAHRDKLEEIETLIAELEERRDRLLATLKAAAQQSAEAARTASRNQEATGP
ncbi:transcriptional regulator, MerR family [Nannocystis exedens]|uniref:Transcriptional regulator, MerR family n=1 Tax=Nannocystis exedens TaxID=54 RepID=A0A1I1ZCN6_9BACT|nr:MerR family transcriptional regulator [Nannocystis exedens]PCC75037.1 MerR family transcriptional regulator [Nannocystis exedens]SFE29521.1 transcriptional regulator, MerR family [Nannocystis exedens]